MRAPLFWVLIPGILLICSCRKNSVQTTIPPPVITDINLVAETVSPVLIASQFALNDNIGGFYTSLPVNYSKTSKSYPLIVSVHGGGQYGNGSLDLPLLLNDGIPQLLDEKVFPPSFKVNGINYSFIIIAPQLKKFPSAAEIKDVIDYVKKNYRIDSSRVYLCGLSNGGINTCITGGTYADQIAAIVPVSGEYNDEQVCSSLAKNKVAVWDFHNDQDPVIDIKTATGFIATLNSFSPAIPPKLTIFHSDKHDAWSKAIDPNYKENNMNIYEWMLQYSK